MNSQVTPGAAGLAFSFAEMLHEIQAMMDLAGDFLDRPSTYVVLATWKETLMNFQRNPGSGQLRWEIPIDHPVRTDLSEGCYQRANRGRHNVVGELSSLWEIAVETDGRKRRRASERFVLCGNASTRVCIRDFEADGERILASWTFDVASADAPGCHFHTQVSWDREQTGDISLDVPRFPTFLVTPMDVLEFLLAELFQDQWPRHAVAKASDTGWSTLQRRRLQRVLGWHLQEFASAAGSPWTSFKIAGKPPADMLVDSQ